MLHGRGFGGVLLIVAWVGLELHVRAQAWVFGVMVWYSLVGFVELEGDGQGLYGWRYRWLVERRRGQGFGWLVLLLGIDRVWERFLYACVSIYFVHYLSCHPRKKGSGLCT